MPSDSRTPQVLAALAAQIDVFKSAVATTSEAVRDLLQELGASPESHRSHLTTQFGEFGAAHLDGDRVAALLDRNVTANRDTLRTIERALAPLDALAKAEPESLVVSLEPGASLYETVASMLSHIGRAFAAARLVQAARGGDSRLVRTADRLASFPYEQWNTSERRVAPPVIVELEGADARATGLTEFLDGRQRIVLVIRGACSPAPLVRLISPGTFVAQVETADDLGRFLDWTGPAVAAVVPDTAALFEHDPRRGTMTWERLVISRRPGARPRSALRGLSAAQQEEELQLLATLAQAPATAAVDQPDLAAVTPADPADKLAAWILSQTDLSNLG